MESIPQLGGLWNRNSILLGSTIAHPVVTVPISTPPAAAASPTTTTHEQRRHQLQQHYHQPHAHNHQPPPRPTSPMTTTNMMSTISINGEVVVGGGGDDGRSGGTTTATTATLNVARSSNHDSQQLLVALLLGCHQLLHLLRQRRRRRRLLLHLQHLRMCRSLFARARAALRPRRRFWMAPQSQQWWECVVQERFADADWLREFRMRRATFERLCSLVAADVAPAAAAAFVRKPVDTRKRVAIALFKLATGAEYRVVGELFGVSKTTVHRYLYRVCRCVCHLLLRHSVHLPALEEARAISERFCKQHVLPQVFGCIGSTHIPVLAPRLGSRDYANRNQWPSIILQTIVDDTLRFRNIYVGVPGNTHHATAFHMSDLYKNPDRLPKATIDMKGVDVPLMIVGEPAFPLLPWLMKIYAEKHLSNEREVYNTHINAILVKVEQAFVKLKGRWRILLKRSDVHHMFMPTVVATCCVLHNLCEEQSDDFLTTWQEEVKEMQHQQPQPKASQCEGHENHEAVVIRDALVAYITEHVHQEGITAQS